MSKLPIKTFTEIIAGFERWEDTRQLAEAIKDWLTALQRTPEDVHSFTLSAENALGALFHLEMQCGPAYDVSLTFKDGSKEKARFSLASRCLMTWADMLKAVHV